MILSVFTNTDTAENGPSLDAAATHGHYETQVDGQVRFVFSATVPNLDAPDEDSGLWTVVLTLTPGEAHDLAQELLDESYKVLRVRLD